MSVICFSFLPYRLRRGVLKTDSLHDGLPSWQELRHRVSASASHTETNLLPGNKRVKRAITVHHSCGITRSTVCEPTVIYCKEANFLMYRWETSLWGLGILACKGNGQVSSLSSVCFIALEIAHNRNTMAQSVRYALTTHTPRSCSRVAARLCNAVSALR